MKHLLMMGAALAVIASVPALAETTPAQGERAGTTANVDTTSHQAAKANVRQQLASNLQQAGFTDVRIMPDSFLVQAKDKSGNPVTMFINPTSMTMVTRDDVGMGRTPNGQASATGQMGSTGEFANIPANEDLSSKVVGLDVYNNANQDIGKIKDIAFDDNGVKAYIVAVGGFLGMGDHYVAVNPSAIDIHYDANAKKWHAAMNTNADQLKAAPEYKYSSND